MKWCDVFGHKYKPYEHLWIEFLPNRDAKYNREGVYRLKTVYCTRCGIIRDVIREGEGIYYGSS